MPVNCGCARPLLYWFHWGLLVVFSLVMEPARQPIQRLQWSQLWTGHPDLWAVRENVGGCSEECSLSFTHTQKLSHTHSHVLTLFLCPCLAPNISSQACCIQTAQFCVKTWSVWGGPSPLCEQPLFVDTGSMVMVTGISSQGFTRKTTQDSTSTQTAPQHWLLFFTSYWWENL